MARGRGCGHGRGRGRGHGRRGPIDEEVNSEVRSHSNDGGPQLNDHENPGNPDFAALFQNITQAIITCVSQAVQNQAPPPPPPPPPKDPLESFQKRNPKSFSEYLEQRNQRIG